MALLVAIGGLVALFITFVSAQNACGDGFDRWAVTRSIVPTTSGYGYTVAADDNRRLLFQRTSLLKFYLGGRRGFSLANFTKPSLVSLFWPTWDFMCDGVAGVMQYNFPHVTNRYSISFAGNEWQTNQIVTSSIPGAITINDAQSNKVASFNQRVAGTPSYNVCVKQSLSNCEKEIVFGVVISYSIK